LKYFVWIAGLKGPEAQIWDEKNKTSEGKIIKTLMIVPVQDHMGLAQCQAEYPMVVNEAKS
jgi:hypothetical protein